MPVPQNAMSQLEATSAILGEFMLKGWTLTDLHCDTCRTTPLMREPAAQASAANRPRIQFCALCDGGPNSRIAAFQTPDVPSSSTIQYASPLDPDPPIAEAASGRLDRDRLVSDASSSRTASIRRSALPPASAPPDRALPFTPQSADALRNFPAPPAHIPRRPSQLSGIDEPANAIASATTAAITSTTTPSSVPSSDEVPNRISQRLLQGYSLLQINCPSPECRGVPLIGYPRRPDGEKDARRACVSCGKGYISEAGVGAGGMSPMQQGGGGGPSRTIGSEVQSQSRQSTAQSSSVPAGGESPRSRARREMYETGETIMQIKREAEHGGQEGGKSNCDTFGQGLGIQMQPALDDSDESPRGRHQIPDISLTASLNRASSSLARTLDRLSNSLDAHTLGNDAASEARFFVDVKLHTEAMRDVLEVVQRVRALQ